MSTMSNRQSPDTEVLLQKYTSSILADTTNTLKVKLSTLSSDHCSRSRELNSKVRHSCANKSTARLIRFAGQVTRVTQNSNQSGNWEGLTVKSNMGEGCTRNRPPPAKRVFLQVEAHDGVARWTDFPPASPQRRVLALM